MLDPGTEYYAIAFGLSTDGVATTAPTVKEFKTLSDGGNNGGGSSQNAFSISVSGVTATGVTVNVTPSNNDSYYFDVIEKSVFDSYNSPAAFAADYWAMVAEVYESYGYPISYALSQGSDGYTYEDSLDPNTEYYAFAFGVSTAGTITTGVTTKAFTTLSSGSRSVASLQKAEHIANVKKLALKRVVRAKSTKLAAVKSNRVVKRDLLR